MKSLLSNLIKKVEVENGRQESKQTDEKKKDVLKVTVQTTVEPETTTTKKPKNKKDKEIK